MAKKCGGKKEGMGGEAEKTETFQNKFAISEMTRSTHKQPCTFLFVIVY